MAQYAQTFRQGDKRRINPAYKKPLDKRRGKQEWLKRNEHKISQEQKAAVKAEIDEINQYLRTIPYVDPMDDGYKRLVYVRYADDFLIGVIGSKVDAKQVKADVGQFIRQQLLLDCPKKKRLSLTAQTLHSFLSFPKLQPAQSKTVPVPKLAISSVPTPDVSSCMCQRRSG